MHNFTSNDLLLYVLNEANSDTIMAIEKAMKNNHQIKQEIKSLQLTVDEINHFEMQPNDKIMDFIMEDLFEAERNIVIV
ncbi:MAG: hypothetical protein IPH46_02645 [Bacteroidetes bacterium]|nr:hypothetical protein [Bacteroidota bacterium]